MAVIYIFIPDDKVVYQYTRYSESVKNWVLQVNGLSSKLQCKFCLLIFNNCCVQPHIS
jgi:hypothetical protein